MSAQYLITRDDTTTVIKVLGLGDADAVLASARSAGGVLTDATVTSATVEDAVVFAATLPVLSAGRYELDVVAIAADGACSQLLRAVLQVREGLAAVAAAATTYEVTASNTIANIDVTLVAGSAGAAEAYPAGWQVINDLDEVTSSGSYVIDLAAFEGDYLNYPQPPAGAVVHLWAKGVTGSTLGLSQLGPMECDAPCLNSGRFASAAVGANTLVTMIGVSGSSYVILAVEAFSSI